MKVPYRWNQINLDLMYGRDRLLMEIIQSVPSVNGESFGVTGARRMGKTTLLRAIERDLLEGKLILRESGTALVPVYIDGLTLPRPLKAEFLWSMILFEMNRHLSGTAGPRLEEIDFLEFVAAATSLIGSVELVPKVIVIFDEIEHIIINDWSASFFANWRALLSNYPSISGFFSAIFSGALEMAALQHDVGSPLMDVLQWRSLRSLSIEDTKLLVTEPLILSVKEEMIALLFKETGGHPMILQYIMQKALTTDHASVEGGMEFSLRDFESSRSWQLAEWWSKYCDLNSQLVYAALPIDGSYKKISTFAQELGGYASSKAFEILQHVGIAELNEDGSEVRRRGELFSRWQQVNGNVTYTCRFDAGLAQLLAQLNEAFRDKYISAWTIYGQEMPNYSGAVSEMRDLVTQVLHHGAPDDAVVSQLGFQFERDQSKPTRRQRVMYLFGAEKREQAKSVASDDELLELHGLQLAGALSRTYANASALTHTTASRPLAYQSLKQGESILAQLASKLSAAE